MTMPSGANPDGWNAADGTNPAQGYDATAMDPFPSIKSAIVGAGLSGLAQRTKANVTALKQAEVSNNETLKNLSNEIFEGLPIVKLPLAIVEAIVTRLFGHAGNFPTTQDALAAIEKIPVIGDIVEAIIGVEDGDTSDLGTFFLNIRNFFSGINFLDASFNPAAAANAFTTTVVKPFLDIITGIISPEWLPEIPLSNIGNRTPNLLSNGGFDTDVSVADNLDWTWDGAVGRTGTGSVKTVANGGVRELFANSIPCSSGQQLDLSAWTHYEGVTSTTGGAIQLCVTTYLAGSVVAKTVIASVANPTGSPAGWRQLHGTFTVPDGVDEIRVSLALTAGVTAGTVWFDDADAHKVGLLRQEWIKDLLGDLGTLGTQIETLIHNLLSAPATVIGSIGETVIDGIGNTVGGFLDGLFHALTGQNQTSTHAADTAAQLAELAATTAANAAAIADLQVIEDGNTNGGLVSNDDFERMNATGIGPGWHETYTLDPTANGRYTLADGHQAAWIDGGNATNAARFRRTDPADALTLTDFQKVGLVIGSIAGEGPQFGGSSVDRIFGRMSADETQFVYAQMFSPASNQDVLELRYQNGAASGLLETVNFSGVIRSAGATFYLICGTQGGLNIYQVIRNGSVIATFQDTSNLIAVGPNNRGWGWGGQAGNKIAGQATPSSVTRVTIADNAPPPLIGTTFRASKTANTTPTVAGPLSANCLNVTDYCTSDLIWNPSTSTLTVTKSGTYLFSYQLTTGGTNIVNNATLIKGGVAIRQSGLIASLGFASISTLVYMNAGESIQPGTLTNVGSVLPGTGGTLTWFEASLVNR